MTTDQTILGEKRFYLSYISISQPIAKGNHNRNSSRSLEAETEAERDHGEMLLSDLFPWPSPTFPVQPRTTHLGLVPLRVG